MDVVRFILNVLWLVFFGFASALGYALAGVIMFILIITIPFGIASFRLAGYALWPYGRTVVPDPLAGAPSTIGNVLWFLLAGWWLALGQVVIAIGQFLTIIGIPFGIANLKLARLSINPLGKQIVDVRLAEHARSGSSPYQPVQ
jgi:uncharacterized membrane protein YccF (DUF307 family)